MIASRQACERRAVLRRPQRNFADWPLGTALKHRQACLKPRHPKSFVEALKQAMSETHDIELLYDVWEQNIETLRVLHRSQMSGLASFPLWSATYVLAPSISSSAPATEAPTFQGKRWHPAQDRQERSHHQRAEAHPLQGASEFLSPSSPVSFADDHLATLITSATPNQEASGSR